MAIVLKCREPKKVFTEALIQDRLYQHLERVHHEMVTNVYLYDWESDMISVTKAGYVHEYEVKVSHGDFLADRKKVEKHAGVEHGRRELSEYEKTFVHFHKPTNSYTYGGNPMSSDLKVLMKRPNYFWYACPPDVIKEHELPSYSGLMYVEDKRWNAGTVIKQAPKLHKEQITAAQTMTILVAIYYRYWRLRIKQGPGAVSEGQPLGYTPVPSGEMAEND